MTYAYDSTAISPSGYFSESGNLPAAAAVRNGNRIIILKSIHKSLLYL